MSTIDSYSIEWDLWCLYQKVAETAQYGLEINFNLLLSNIYSRYVCIQWGYKSSRKVRVQHADFQS